MKDKITEAANWVNSDLSRTFHMAAEKFKIQSNEMIQLYAKYAELRAKAPK